MKEQKAGLRNTVMNIIETLYQGEAFFSAEFFDSEMQLWMPYVQNENGLQEMQAYLKKMQPDICKIHHRTCSVLELKKDFCACSGSYLVEWNCECARWEQLFYTLALKKDANGKIKLRHLHISVDRETGKRHHVKDIQENVFFIEEEELLYLEASHNHIFWHCKYFVVESVGTLKKMEEELSERFVRIQRSYIVNAKHVKKIARCYVEMDNGAILQIPVKKYCDIKERLLQTKGE